MAVRESPLQVLAFHWEQAADAGGDRAYYGAFDSVTVFGVEDAKRDDGNPGRREGEREEERIFEDFPREMPHVSEHARGFEHHEQPPLQQYGEQYEARVDETVEEPI